MAVEPRITIQDKQVKAALERLRLGLPLGGGATPAFQGMGRVLLSGLQLRFRKGVAPDGTAWKKSRRVIESGGQTLRDKGILRNSFSYVATGNSVTIGTNVIYAAIHHFGGTIRHPGGTRFVLVDGEARFVSNSFMGPVHGLTKPHPIPMPARPILGASKSDIEGLLKSLQGHIEGRWNGR
jgi:phage gpG-like protein